MNPYDPPQVDCVHRERMPKAAAAVALLAVSAGAGALYHFREIDSSLWDVACIAWMLSVFAVDALAIRCSVGR